MDEHERWLSSRATRRRCLQAISAGTATRALTVRATPSMPTPRLHTDGKWLRDPFGRRVVLRGLNVTDPHWGDVNADWRGKTTREVLELATDADRGWYPRVIRLPCLPETVDEIGLDTLYREHVRPVVEFCRRQGVYCILDYHAIERYDTDGIDRRLRAFWDHMAPRLADDSHVLFELFNEPTEPYGEGRDSWERWRATAQPWVDRLREHAPATPIIVGSPRWSSLAMHAADAPFEGSNLLYAVHHYPGHPESRLDAYAAAAASVPLLVTEWGYIGNPEKPEHMVGTTSGFGEPFREWLQSVPNLGWLAWCFDSVWDPKMFDENWALRSGDAYMGQFVKTFLAETRDQWRLGGGFDSDIEASLAAIERLLDLDPFWLRE